MSPHCPPPLTALCFFRRRHHSCTLVLGQLSKLSSLRYKRRQAVTDGTANACVADADTTLESRIVGRNSNDDFTVVST